VKGAVALNEVGAVRPCEPPEGVFECLRRQLGVQARGRIAQPLRQHHLAVVMPLGQELIGRDLGAVRDPPADGRKQAEGGLFDIGFRKTSHRCGFASGRTQEGLEFVGPRPAGDH
jgi:hypothetical protein